MSMVYDPAQPSRADIDRSTGPVVLQFGTNWCGYCLAAEPLIERALATGPAVRRIKVEDGSGRALGRSFRIKLWPTLVFLQDGRELARVVRPKSVQEVEDAFKGLTDRLGISVKT